MLPVREVLSVLRRADGEGAVVMTRRELIEQAIKIDKELLNDAQITELQKYILDIFRYGCTVDFFTVPDPEGECTTVACCDACWDKEL